MALGSDAASVVWIVVKEATQLVLIGCAAGMAVALAAGRSIAAYLFGVSALDPPAMLAAAGLMLAVAAAAVCVPALRASRVDPLAALRHD